MQVRHISDTARWVATYRAMETERPDALFRDPFAARLAGTEGPAIVAGLRHGRSMAWAMIVRTAVFDELIMTQVTSYHADLVLNLAAGLDARPWRLAFPAALRWVDVDLPEILEYKVNQLKNEQPACVYQAIPADLTQPEALADLVNRLGPTARRVLVVTEGLMIYLTPADAAALARALSTPPSFLWWLIDLASPKLLKYLQQRWGKSLEEGRAPFQFAPQEGTGFFLPHGWHEVVFRSSGEEAHRLGREMRFMWLWRLIARLSPRQQQEEFRRMAGYVLLARRPGAEGLAGVVAG
jgi:methyltransferase (TIGR00027 family)